MKQLLCLAAVVVAGGAAGCGGGSPTYRTASATKVSWEAATVAGPGTRATSPAPAPARAALKVRDAGGKDVTIDLRPDVVVLLMATWCPHSGPVRDRIKQHKGREGLAGLRVVYVFEDEWPVARDMLVRETGTPAAQVEQQLRAKREAQGGGPLIAPDFLKACDAEVFYAHPDHPLPGSGYPRVVARDGAVRPGNAAEWLNGLLGR